MGVRAPAKTSYEIVRERGPLPVDRACGLVGQLAAALGETHRRNWSTATSSRRTSAVTPDGVAKLLDFGMPCAGRTG